VSRKVIDPQQKLDAERERVRRLLEYERVLEMLR